MSRYDFCLCMGRFQPFHWGHWDLVQVSLEQGDQVIILLGSHHRSPTGKNPWNSEERSQMIRMCLTPSDQVRVQMVPICDCETNEEWVSTIHSKVYGIANSSHKIAIAGHHDDGKGFFAQWFADWAYVEQPRRPNLNATDIRSAYFGGLPETHYEDQLPAGTLQYLRAFKTQLIYQRLCQEYHV